MDSLGSFLSGSRWVWVTILVVAIIAIGTRLLGW